MTTARRRPDPLRPIPSIGKPACPRGETGSFTVFVAVLAVGLWVLLGLVVDSGRAIAARAAALSEAEQAARAGVAQLSVVDLRAGRLARDPVAAARAADQFLTLEGQSGSVVVTGGTVTVIIHTGIPTTILGMIGIRRISVSAAASATNVHGVTREDR